MQLHNLERTTPLKSKKRVGRGGTRGKTSGRGHKGQNARAGNSKRPEERDIIKKLPKLRGQGKNKNTSIKPLVVAVSVATLDKVFAAGDTVSIATLKSKKVLRKTDRAAKVLGQGKLSKKLTIKIPASATAKAVIEGAGGTIEA